MKNILGNILLVMLYIAVTLMIAFLGLGLIWSIAVGLSLGPTTTIYYQDNDGDGFGNDQAHTIRFDEEPVPTGYATKGGDCDDSNPDIHPGAEEIKGNAIDENCDGITDPQKAKRK